YGGVWKPVEYHLHRDRHHDRERENVVLKLMDAPAERLERHLQCSADCRDAAWLDYPRCRGHHHAAVSLYLGDLQRYLHFRLERDQGYRQFRIIGYLRCDLQHHGSDP